MTMRTILVPWWPGHASLAVLDTALAVARRVQAHLDVVHVQPDQAEVMAGLHAAALDPTDLTELAAHRGSRAAVDGRDRFAAWRRHHDLPGEMTCGQLRSTFARWSERVGLPEQVIVRKGRLSDMAVLEFPGRAAPLDRALDAALFETGRPVLLVPREGAKEPLRHVAVSWDGSLQATRAVAGAMPLLYQAERVTVLTAAGPADGGFADGQPDGDLDLAAALEWHGIRAGRCHVVADAAPAGGALLRAAGERDATLLVMGGYTHSRVTAAFLGGVTGHVLRHPPPMPVLMGH